MRRMVLRKYGKMWWLHFPRWAGQVYYFHSFEEALEYFRAHVKSQRKFLQRMQLREDRSGICPDNRTKGVLHDAVVSSGRLTRAR